MTETITASDWTPEQIREALSFSRNFATAKPDIGETEKLHILGLCNLLERVATPPAASGEEVEGLAESLDLMAEGRDAQGNNSDADCLRTAAGMLRRLAAVAPADEEKEAMRRALRQIKLRLHFIGWPAESFFNTGTEEAPHWVPDWRYEIALLEHALHGSPIEAAEKPADTTPRNMIAALVPGGWKVPPLDDESRWILGRPNFTVGYIARILRHAGHSIAAKAEEEQATVIHWMLGIYAEHGATWRDVANAKLADMAAKESA